MFARSVHAAGVLLAVALTLLAAPAPAAVLITEFLAQNHGGLRDADGETPDWIELHNDGAAAFSLAGWHLTDAPAALSKWTFPATNIGPGGYLIVFASGKDRAVPGAELHTSFKLDQGGGYLALVQPDGVTIAQSITYGAQRANVSAGLGRQSIGLIPAGAAARVLVPTNDVLGLTWTARDFNDAAWSSSNAPVGFSVSATVSTVLSVDFNERAQDPIATTLAGFQSFMLNSNVSATAIQTQATTRVFGAYTVTVSNTAPLGYDDRLRTTPANTGTFVESLLFRDFIFSRDDTGTGGLDVLVTGLAANRLHRLTLWSYDSGSPGLRVADWSANGVLGTNNYSFDGNVLPTSDGQYRFFFSATSDSAGRLLLTGRRDPASTGGLGVFLNALRIGEITAAAPPAGLGALMLSNTASAYLRVPFAVADPAGFSALNLRLRYNDGFIAYINGQPVAARNAPDSPSWNSTATASHPADAVESVTIVVTPNLLVAGQNVLALHGLNLHAADPDFLLAPELSGEQFTSTPDRYFQPPTPGTNNPAGYPGFVADTKFSVDRGFFDTPFTVAITTATAGASIRWSTNGSAPTDTAGNVYTGPIAIAGTTHLRAAAFAPGLIPSDVDTHTYLFLAAVRNQPAAPAGYPTLWQSSYPADYGMDPTVVNHPVYGSMVSNALRSIPTLSIVSDQNGLWNASTGIYPNATSSGPAWERAASLELINGTGATEFAANGKIEMHGNASRDNARTPKHSIRVTFSGDFGPAMLHYDWFRGPGAKAHNKIILRSAGFVDGWAGRYADAGTYVSTETGETFRGLRYRPENTCYLRDVWVKESLRDMGWLSSRSQYVHLYLNGLYWGLYQPSEAIGASYFAETIGGPEDAWDVVVGEDNDGPPVLVDGSLAGWQNVLNLVNAGIASDAAYQAVAQQVDLDNLIDYMLLHIFAESEDWPRHNWYVARRRATNALPGTKFICLAWDQELTLDRLVRRNRINVGTTGGEIYGPARVYAQLRNWPEFRRQFGDRLHRHLFNTGALTPSRNVARLLAQAGFIRDAVIGESARWGDAREFAIGANPGTGQTFTRNEWWQPEIDKLTTNFFQKLTADNVARFRAGNLYPALNAPVFDPFGGAVPAGFSLTITNPNPAGVIYFTTDGADPRVYGTSGIAPTAQAYSSPIPINTPTLLRARVLSAGTWSALVEASYYPPQDLRGLALTEIMFNPPALGPTNGDDFEFVELQNTGASVLNLSGLTFTDAISFTFPNGTLLAPGAFLVLAQNSNAFAARYPGVPLAGVYSGRLANGGERLSLAHPLGTGIFSVDFDDEAPWPLAADGYGFSIVPRQPGLSQAPDRGQSWRASTQLGGSPGTADPEPSIPAVVINEILTASVPPAVDRIELFNPTAEPADVSGWFLTDDHADPFKFRIPDGTTIAAGSHAFFMESQFNPAPGAAGSFSLSARGEGIYLFSADATAHLTGYSHGFTYGAAAPGVTFGRHLNSVGEEQFPAQLAPTFGAPNAGPAVGPVVIREIHYHPVPGDPEFVELANITDQSVPLFDPAAPTNTWRLNGLDFPFPTQITLPPGGVLLLVSTNPAVFRARYAVPESVAILGPFTGELQDSGERLQLERPAAPDTNSLVYIVVDAVRYNDKAPWPAAADGTGLSLQRDPANAYGDDPAAWRPGVPTPGSELLNGDADLDGLPDTWEIDHGTNPFVNDANEDPDADGLTNAQELAAGTHPNQPASTLRVELVQADPDRVTIRFERAALRTYHVLFKDSLDAAWSVLTEVPAGPFPELIEVTDELPASTRFYRVVTP